MNTEILVNLWAAAGLMGILAVSYKLCVFKICRWLSPPVLALMIVTLLVNLGALPGPGDVAVYRFINGTGLSIAIFLLLLQLDFSVFRRAGPNMLIFYLIGAIGVIAGTLGTIFIPWIGDSLGDAYPPLSGMLAASFVGGTVNFNSVAAVVDLNHDGPTFVIGFAVANVMAASWLIVSVIVAPFLRRLWAPPQARATEQEDVDAPALGTADLAILGAGTVLAILVANWLSAMVPALHPILWLTAVSIAAAQTPLGRLARSAEPLAVLILYLFIAAVGVDVSFAMLIGKGMFALATAVLILISFTVSGALLFFVARWRRADTDLVLVASQAGIGGPATALALADTLGRRDLRAPGVAASLVGYAIGTYFGLLVVVLLGGAI